MKRRALNFISDSHVNDLYEHQIESIEQELDNVVPKVIAILGLS